MQYLRTQFYLTIATQFTPLYYYWSIGRFSLFLAHDLILHLTGDYRIGSDAIAQSPVLKKARSRSYPLGHRPVLD